MVSLNPEAPEFFPTHTFKLQQKEEPFSCPNFITSTFTPHSHYYYVVSSFPSRELHPHYVYYPATTFSPPSIPTPLAAPQSEPPRIHRTEKEPGPVDSHEVNQKKDEVVVAEDVKCGAKGLVQKQVFKAFISYGTMNDQRSEGTRMMKAYVPRRKGEEKGQRRSFDFSKSGKVTRHPDEQYCWRGYTKKKRCFPLLPVRVDKNETTVMIRNIPSKYTRDMLVEFLDSHCMKVNLRDKEKDEESCCLAFDFVYLPIDFKTGMNKGYAFVNFTKPQAAWKFLLTASNMKWDLFQSHKIREVVSARLQGKERLEKHFETMNFPSESEDVLPVCFNPPRDGVIKGKQITCGKLRKHEQV
ncbi:hypothetical protein DEO72_LG3g3169 [Vigna unguiculata]|uniref:Mei2-like C-terminal RNA recognition motif domain-containing protein n=1 Tax=Vigna unguiculata TaxID=3917 RepID=A0A4D6LIV6_VIGUN|nr:hypothetical protein DEO72_LG3g3169 [Vigna unguiculata]